jgi:hypothetical protein
MNAKRNGGMLIVLGLTLAVGVGIGMTLNRPALADAGKNAGGGPRYSVVETQAVNLLVTDNQTNTLYFYTVDEGEKPGADLKLRGSIDLNKVGQPVLSPKRTREKDDKK